MKPILVPVIKQARASDIFLASLNIDPDTKDGRDLVQACKSLYLLNQAGMGAEWESNCYAILNEVVQQVGDRHSLYCLFSTEKNGPPVKFALKPIVVNETFRLIGANVWAW